MALFGLFGKEKKEDLDKGLEKTREGLFSRISRAVAGKATVDAEFLDELEEILISSDVGLDTTVKIIGRLEERVARDKYLNTAELQHILREEIVRLLTDSNTPDYDDFQLPASADPYIILVVGVNGVGKTTTIGKLASQFKSQGKKVLLGAADTFRAAAIDQLSVWADRTGVEIIRHQMGADPAAVAFDTVNVAKNKGADVVLIDTAGRLHNKVNLMNELSKIKRVIQKVYPDAPQEVLLVLDASTGQNALEQARHFTAATEVTAIALTKLDGTAKGGVVLGIADQFRIPVKYIGVGEQVHQLQVFNKKAFVDALFHEPA
ncbi:MAG: signal recognition particle-docking protein FtsY [Chitinophagales bacterium]|nr:signal recognition particle-docking protein FtsY [Chitinophagales bacterium]HAE14796.1 signal recognition particle-docking protein FtsY [Bacteroidota bacterium]MCB9021696.1 signal recognition particle-docking protein FtsY [Chitinophagales bacterium]MCB9031053.1 signal recognition particle-docking protein FtsY [Chitinophagales bacterium]HAE34557.1 signal recognition particle-docking protein FtsY [Bacteroidota bacterium]